jgi:hypothetical protein
MTDIKDPAKRIYRHGWPPAYPYTLAAIFFALMLVVIVGFPEPLMERFGAACILLPPALLCIRMARIGAHFTEKQLLLVHLFRTKRLSWQDVRAFVVAPRGVQPLAVSPSSSPGNGFGSRASVLGSDSRSPRRAWTPLWRA